MKDLAVVILNWNGKNHLETYLPSVNKFSVGYDIILIDNHSTDSSVAFVEQNYPDIKIILNKENGGFAKGYNDGLAKITGLYEYYVLLNSDVEVTENWITPILDKMKSDELIAAMQPKILADKRRSHFEHAGAAGGFIDKNGYPFCRGRIFSNVEEDLGQYDDESQIFWSTGACMFVKGEVFHNLGGFDEDYFAHMEEIDLCWRMQIKAYKIYFSPKSTVYHLGGGTLNYMSPRKVYLNFRNSLFTLYKNYTGAFLFFKIFNRFLFDYVAVGMFLIKLDFKSMLQIFRAHVHFFRELKKLKVKRKYVQSEIKKKDFVGVYMRSIVWDFFLFGKKRFSQLDKAKITD